VVDSANVSQIFDNDISFGLRPSQSHRPDLVNSAGILHRLRGRGLLVAIPPS
jgi:hypothetical protein